MEFQEMHSREAFSAVAPKQHPTDDETRLLAIAAMCGHLDRVQDFINRYPAAVDATTSYGNGWTALMWAARDAQFPVIDYLLEQGAKIESRNRDGYSVLEIAKLHNYESCARQIERLREEKLEAMAQRRAERIAQAISGGLTSPLKVSKPLRFERNKNG